MSGVEQCDAQGWEPPKHVENVNLQCVNQHVPQCEAQCGRGFSNTMCVFNQTIKISIHTMQRKKFFENEHLISLP